MKCEISEQHGGLISLSIPLKKINTACYLLHIFAVKFLWKLVEVISLNGFLYYFNKVPKGGGGSRTSNSARVIPETTQGNETISILGSGFVFTELYCE
jgi:hypothetical protein